MFGDLTSRYDTAWKNGLVHKVYNGISRGQTLKLIENMLSNRNSLIKTLRPRRLRTLKEEKLKQDVLGPLFWNLYTSDLPNTTFRKFIYTDNFALAGWNQNFTIMKFYCFTQDLTVLNDFCKK